MNRYTPISTKQFRKDIRRLQKAGYNLVELQHVISLLSADERLPEKYRDHALRGALQGTRECHIKPDWLLRYEKDLGQLILVLVSTGSHRHVLGIE